MSIAEESPAVLVLTDDTELAKAIQTALEETGFRCWRGSGIDGLVADNSQFQYAIVDAAVLQDVEQLSKLKVARPRLGVVLLSELDQKRQRLAALAVGVDDFLIKPLRMPELIARLEACSARSRDRQATQLRAGPLTMDLVARRATRDKRELMLTPTEFRLLETFVRNAGRVVTRGMLSELLWDFDGDRMTNVIEVHINRLRAKLTRAAESRLIFTVRGSGYMLCCDPAVDSQAGDLVKSSAGW